MDSLTDAIVEVWPSPGNGVNYEKKDYVCRKNIGPISGGDALSVKCYRPLYVSYTQSFLP